MDDTDIINLFYNRIENAIFETKQKYGRLIISISFHILKNMSDAEECENDTYMGLWNLIPPNRPKSFKAYMLKIARNYALKRYEYNHAEKRDVSKNISYNDIIESLENITEDLNAFSETEITECINDFLENLKMNHRKVFICRYWYFMSVKEIMDECDMSKSKVESILFRTRNQLKKVLMERGYVHEEYYCVSSNE